MNKIPIRIRGREVQVSGFKIDQVSLVVTGTWLKIARIQDEEYVDRRLMPGPARIVDELKQEQNCPDILSFGQAFTDNIPCYSYPFVWDNAAAIVLHSYDDWFKSLSQETRRNIRLASKRGVTVREDEFSHPFVAGISGINNETPVRQGRRFWHYGKDLESVERENGTYRDCSSFIGAWLGSELVGYIKLVYMNQTANVMQILSKVAHQEKKVTNALLAKAVELACEHKCSHLVYCKYSYRKNVEEPLREFKRRSGFVRFDFPRYYIPLTVKGRWAVACQLHRPKSDLIPGKLMSCFLWTRMRLYDKLAARG